jgi:hypothetical protein
VRLRLPAVIVPVVDMDPPSAVSVRLRVPAPRFELWMMVEALSTMAVVPDVADALSSPALVLLMVAPPVPLFRISVPVDTKVPPD